ncbi:general stress protein [Paeniglutamicibacter sp. NPDC012692]|uniref:general stress protein n=1 Tax=Paeniglutamicibacter sp. NPDC012692 TaxID=3364388 RepID=UPI0036C5A468
MSSPLGASQTHSNSLGLPRGELLGRYDSYLDAQKIVDYLADNDFPVSNITIVGNDLKSVERVTAKLSYPKVAAAGAAQGAMFGVFVGLILSIFNPASDAWAQILSSVGLGIAIWLIVAVVGYSFRRGKRDFASQSQVLATSYDVVVDFSHAHAARALASKLPMSRGAADAGVGIHAVPVQPPAPAQPQAPAVPGAGQAPAAPAAPVPSGSYSDLPDGRPQFGIRVQPVATAAPVAPATQAPEAPVAASAAVAAQPHVAPESVTPEATVPRTPAPEARAADAAAPAEGQAAATETAVEDAKAPSTDNDADGETNREDGPRH